MRTASIIVTAVWCVVFSGSQLVRAGVIQLADGANLYDAYVVAEGMSPSASDPVMILLEPGVFVSKTSGSDATLAMDNSYIHLIGSGKDVSIIQGTSNPVIRQSADNVVIGNLSIEQTSALDRHGFDQTSDVTASSLIYNCAIRNTNPDCAGIAFTALWGRGEGLTIVSYDTCIGSIRGTARLSHSILRLPSGGSDVVYGIHADALVEHCILDGGGVGAYAVDTIDGTMRFCELIGPVDLYDDAELHNCVVTGNIVYEESGYEIKGPLLGPDEVDTDNLVDGAVTTAKIDDGTVVLDDMAAAVAAQLTKQLDFTVGSESGDTITVTIQVQDRKSNNLSDYLLVNLWLSDSQYGAPTSDGTVTMSASTGTLKQTITAEKELVVITNSSGQVAVDVGHTGTPTFYVCAEVDGEIWVCGAVTFSN